MLPKSSTVFTDNSSSFEDLFYPFDRRTFREFGGVKLLVGWMIGLPMETRSEFENKDGRSFNFQRVN
jgi:hypothetical protein